LAIKQIVFIEFLSLFRLGDLGLEHERPEKVFKIRFFRQCKLQIVKEFADFISTPYVRPLIFRNTKPHVREYILDQNFFAFDLTSGWHCCKNYSTLLPVDPNFIP